ncbi:MAG: DUF5110 domain-containing protein [Bacteroidaceae bacterium]|nr:DUF5110 domain-containing protein [Bacteroidaceae bacterium]
MNRWFFIVSVLCLAASAGAQTKTEVIPYGNNIVRVVKTTGNSDAKSLKQSLVVTARQEPKSKMDFKWSVDDKGNVTFSDRKGNILLREGDSRFTPITQGPDKGSYKVSQGFALDADEPIYGIGLLQNGKMSQRGENRRMEQSNLEDYAHFFQSIKGYGVFWDNYSPTLIQDRDNLLTWESEVGGLIDYYFMYGGNADGVIACMRNLSGHVPMLPLWTYGFHQCRERYKSQDELLEVVHRYRDLRIPFDGIIQDWQYWGSNYTWNAMEFLNDQFPQPQRMIDEVHRQNAHLSISIWASFGPETKPFRELKSKGLLFDFETWPQSGLPQWPPKMDYPSGVRVYDCYSKEARDIYWKYLSVMHKMGIDAWWMDSTDPDHHSYKDSDLDQVVPMTQPDGKETQVSYRSVRNAFPLATVEGVYDAQRAVDSDKRVFILTRSYFSGQQRTGANTWTGDTGSSWDTFRKQIPICLNYTLTANPNVNTDIGGFFAGSYSVAGHNSAPRNPQFQELFVRWMQFGLFNPMMRSHGADIFREIYYFGKEGEPVYDALVQTVRMRYTLMPYIYSTSWDVTKNDGSFMRPLMMDFPEDKNTWNNSREFMFGRNILVCPVLEPLYTEEKISREWFNRKVDWTQEKTFRVYLPSGTEWTEMHTGDKYKGGQEVEVSTNIFHSPVFLKAGTILPMVEGQQHTDQKGWNDMEIKVIPGDNATFTLYEDEGDGYNYEKGLYSTIRLTWNDRSRTLTIGKRQGSFPGMLQKRSFRIGGKTVSYTGKEVKVRL